VLLAQAVQVSQADQRAAGVRQWRAPPTRGTGQHKHPLSFSAGSNDLAGKAEQHCGGT
jgi:hypothetical protein